MTSPTRSETARAADQRLREGDTRGALQRLVALVRSAPHDFDARLRIADGLLAAGQTRAAVEAYTAVARETAAAGRPLKTCVALKVLGALDPGVNEVFNALADRYAQGSQSLGRAVRLSLPDPDATVPESAWLPADLDDKTLLEAAFKVALSREGLPTYPPVAAPIPLLSELPADAFARVLRAVDLVRVPEGAVILREGEPAESFFMVARGSVVVSRDEGRTVLARPGESSVLGEMALVSNAPRMATVTAATDCDLLVFGRAALASVSSELAVVASALERFMQQRLLSNLLATHAIFKPFDEAQRINLADRFETVRCPAGATLIRQGEAGRGLYVLLHGEVRVVAAGESGEVEVARLGGAEVFGEISLLRNAPTTATVTATRDCTVMFLARELFERLVAGVAPLRAYFENLAELRWIDTSLALSGGQDVEVLI